MVQDVKRQRSVLWVMRGKAHTLNAFAAMGQLVEVIGITLSFPLREF